MFSKSNPNENFLFPVLIDLIETTSGDFIWELITINNKREVAEKGGFPENEEKHPSSGRKFSGLFSSIWLKSSCYVSLGFGKITTDLGKESALLQVQQWTSYQTYKVLGLYLTELRVKLSIHCFSYLY